MYSTERLISEVQNYPCLWDMSSHDYNNKDLKKSCWMKIAEVVYSTNWNTLSTTQQEEKADELKNKKWRHICDAYNKYISEEKNIKSGSEATKKKPYAYAESLSFLNNTVKKRKTTGNFEEVEEDDTERSVDDNENDMSEVLNINVPSSSTHQSRKHKKTDNVTPFQKTLIEHLNKNNERESDPDRHLVMSFLPYLKKLNSDQKLDFQLHALNYLKNITQPQITPELGVPIYGSYPTYYSTTQNMPSNMQHPPVSTHPYSYPYASHSQSLLPPTDMPMNPPNSQYSNQEHNDV